MIKVKLKYNPYTLETQICINGKEISPLSSLDYVKNKRLQEWLEPKDNWRGFFKELLENVGDSDLHLSFHGTSEDFRDLKENE